jgi:uncharacterized membrane protein
MLKKTVRSKRIPLYAISTQFQSLALISSPLIVSHKNFTYFSFYGRDLIVVFLVFYVYVHHKSRSKEIKNNHFWNYTGPPINLGYKAVGSPF